MNKKGHISVNLRKFEDEVPPKHHANVKFCECKNVKKIQKSHCVRVPHAVTV